MICSKCQLEKQLYEMRKGKKICKDCTNARFMKWKHKSGFVEYQKQHRLDNKEKLDQSSKKYRENNRDRFNQKYRDKIKNDVSFRLKQYLRNRIYAAVKLNYKSGSAVKDLGCSIEELKLHLESKFQPGMTWENHGKWHIDHIIPLCKFDLTNREQFLQACHFSNLQPLWAVDNIRKGGKLVGVDIIAPDGDLR